MIAFIAGTTIGTSVGYILCSWMTNGLVSDLRAENWRMRMRLADAGWDKLIRDLVREDDGARLLSGISDAVSVERQR